MRCAQLYAHRFTNQPLNDCSQGIIDFPGSSTLFDDFVFFLKDLFDDDNNYSEENWLYNASYFKNSSFAYEKLFQLRESGIENLSISSVFSPLPSNYEYFTN